MKIKAIFVFGLSLLLPLICMAQGKGAEDFSTFSLCLENDAFAKTDCNYTNGIKLSWTSPYLAGYLKNPRLPKWSYSLIDRLPFVNEPGFQRAISISFGQNIYTPEDLERNDLIQDDRPYAGITYFAIGFHSRSSFRMDTLEFDLGIVGRHSYAQDCQEVVHERIDSSEPKGWHNQLKDEPVINIFYGRKWKLVRSGFGSGFGYDLIPCVGCSLGNAYIMANAGAQVRFGWNLPDDFGTFLIRPGSDSNAPLDKREPRFLSGYHRLGIHLFAAADGCAVLRNILLDGNTFRDSHSVDKEPFVANFAVGAGFIIYGFKITCAHVYRTKEFKTQKDVQKFGAITISYTF